MAHATPIDPAKDTAEAALARGNLQLAEFLCRDRLERGDGDLLTWRTLAEIATRAGVHHVAADCWQAARQIAPHDPAVLAAWHAARVAQQRSDAARSARSSPRYLLIKAWGYGFWSDLDHVLSMLLLADLTGRIPVVRWGRNSLFRAPDADNAFTAFFEPVSPACLTDLQQPGQRYFPAKWSASKLADEDVGKWEGPGSRCTGLHLLGRDEEVVVSDFHTKVHDLMPWIPADSPYAGLTRSQIYRAIVQKYLRLKPHLAQRVDGLWAERLKGRHWLAVHVRGSDKVHEIRHLHEVNEAYYGAIDKILSVNPALSIFLLTDSAPMLACFQERYGDRILSLDVIRSSSQTGVHYAGHSGVEVGEQVILDAWLAARCDFFLGNGGSNVSVGIRHLKSWPDGTFFLIGEDFLGQRNKTLHTW